MTSSSEGEAGLSYGWINHDLIRSGEIMKGINPVGGKERFGLGSKGGNLFSGNWGRVKCPLLADF